MPEVGRLVCYPLQNVKVDQYLRSYIPEYNVASVQQHRRVHTRLFPGQCSVSVSVEGRGGGGGA